MLREDNDIVGKRGEKKQIQTLTCCYNTLYQNPVEHPLKQFQSFFRLVVLLLFSLIDSKMRYEESMRNIVRTSRACPRQRERGTLSSSARNVNGYLRDSYCGGPL